MCMMRSNVSALSVSVFIGSKCLTAFHTIAHDTANDRYFQFFARVLGYSREGQMCLLNCAVMSAMAIMQINTHRRNRHRS